MDSEKTFISYSREDSAFVLKLAKDLETAGAKVWLDQLHIKGGERWPVAIEKALEESPQMLIILSPASVASNNVMDEVSYALECGKKVIPVLWKSCQVSFRLRNLQRVDFTNDYTVGLKNLLETLGIPINEITDSRAGSQKNPPSIVEENFQFKVSETTTNIVNNENVAKLILPPKNTGKAFTNDEKATQHFNLAQQFINSNELQKAKLELRHTLYLRPEDKTATKLKIQLEEQIVKSYERREKISKRALLYSIIITTVLFIILINVYNFEENSNLPPYLGVGIFFLTSYIISKLVSDDEIDNKYKEILTLDNQYNNLKSLYEKGDTPEFKNSFKNYLTNWVSKWNVNEIDFITLDQLALIISYANNLNVIELVDPAYYNKTIESLERGAFLDAKNCFYSLSKVYRSGLFGFPKNTEVAKQYEAIAFEKGAEML